MLAALNGLGWLFMAASLGSVTFLTYWCFQQVLRAPGEEPELPGGLGP
jgi:hypothetical protein